MIMRPENADLRAKVRQVFSRSRPKSSKVPRGKVKATKREAEGAISAPPSLREQARNRGSENQSALAGPMKEEDLPMPHVDGEIHTFYSVEKDLSETGSPRLNFR